MYKFLTNYFIILFYKMPSHYGGSSMKRNSPKAKKKMNVGKKTPKGMHRMPDGSFMKGETHGGKKNSPKAKNEPKKFIKGMNLKEGALKKMLKVKEGDKKLNMMELIRALKADNGSMFKFRDVELKMTPLMRKRINTAITLMKLSKQKK